MTYGLLVDAGSSGSRMYIYQWPEHSGKANELIDISPALGEDGTPLIMKVEPGTSCMSGRGRFFFFFFFLGGGWGGGGRGAAGTRGGG